MIRSFLLDHGIDAHVFHENADALWCGAFARPTLAICETDLPSVRDAFAAPRETLADDSPIPDCDFPENDPGPVRFDRGFFLSLALAGVVFAGSICLLNVLFVLFETFPNGLPKYDSGSLEPRPRIGIADLAAPACYGMLGGLLAGVAILAARQLRPDEHGRFSVGARWGILLAVSPMGYFIPIILAHAVFTLRKIVRPSDPDDL